MRTLFKYMSSPRSFFEDGYIRLTQLCALNDPYEFSYCEDGLRQLVADFDEGYHFTKDICEYVEAHKHKIGIISLTEAKDNLLMWAHYGDEHRGLAAGFSMNPILEGKISERLFRPTVSLSSYDGYEPFDGKPVPIMYRKQPRYRIDRYDFDYSCIDAEGADRILHDIFCQKSDEWIYEKEHRIVLRLEQADRVIIPKRHVEEEKLVRELPSSTVADQSNGRLLISLDRMDDPYAREVLARALSEYSADPNVVYLLNIPAGLISSCLLGLRSLYKPQDVSTAYTRSLGYFEIYQATRPKGHYQLEFSRAL